MREFEKKEERYRELVRKPKSNDEIEEMDALLIDINQFLADEIVDLINQLSEVGISISSIWDLVNTDAKYEEAIPILVEHLPKNYHIKNKEGIVRALAVKEAKGLACKGVLKEYLKTPKENFNHRWVLGNTMSVIITEDYVDDVIAIVRDSSNGESRDKFIKALGNAKSSKSKKVLTLLLNEKGDGIAKEAQKALKKIK